MPKIKKGLTPQEKKAVEGIVLGKTKRQAIQEAYNCKNLKVVDEMGQKVFKRERVIDELDFYRSKEREQLLPKATERINEILSLAPPNKPNWETVRKTSEGVINRAVPKNESLKIEQFNFIGRFINLNKLKELYPGLSPTRQKEIEVIEEGEEIDNEEDIRKGEEIDNSYRTNTL